MNKHASRTALLCALLAALLASPGCTMIQNVFGFEQQAEAARQLVRISGTVTTEGPVNGTLVVVLGSPEFAEDGSSVPGPLGGQKHSGVDSYSRRNPGTFLFITEPGSYRLGAYEDRNQNGKIDAGERVVRVQGSELLELAPGGSASVDIRLTDDSVFEGESFDVLGLIERDVHEQGRLSLWAFSRKGVQAELSDERFGRAKGTEGLWKPFDFLNQELAGIYFLEEYDPDRIPVLFVHGIMGFPQEFNELIADLDTERFQPWFYFYPSGFALSGISNHLSDLLRELQIKHDFDEIAVVAHSMGGLVSRGAILKYFADTQRDDVELFISINSPFGGDVKAKSTEGAPIEIPMSFKDMNPDSEYMTWVFYDDEARTEFKPLPGDIPHHMITGFKSGNSPCNDGAVSCESQSHPDLQERAASLRNWNFTHTGTLKQQRTIDRVNLLLKEAF